MTKYVIMTYFVTKYSVQRQRVWPTSYLPAPRLHKPSTLQDMKVLFFQIICDLGLIDTVPPWYSPIKPQSVYETAEVQAYWDVPVYGEYQELRANRVEARIVNNREKQVVALKMSCPWVSNRDKKTSEKTMKYAPLR